MKCFVLGIVLSELLLRKVPDNLNGAFPMSTETRHARTIDERAGGPESVSRRAEGSSATSA
jgi:hypothetical protein